MSVPVHGTSVHILTYLPLSTGYDIWSHQSPQARSVHNLAGLLMGQLASVRYKNMGWSDFSLTLHPGKSPSYMSKCVDMISSDPMSQQVMLAIMATNIPCAIHGKAAVPRKVLVNAQ
jgi:hypothetical protein